jgi:hypothetical protein
VRPFAQASLLVAAALLAACAKAPVDKEGKPINLGRYRIYTYPTGAKVWVNGELKVVSTPATLILPEGDYALRIQKEGAEAMETSIHVSAGAAKSINLHIPHPPDATLTVLSDVAGADVRVNGYRRGATPVLNAVTRPGPVDITITTADGRARSVRTQLGLSEDKTIEVRFNDTSSVAEASPDGGVTPRGLLTLGLQPKGTVTTPDGRKLGDTPLERLPMEPGEHTLVLTTHDGKRTRTVTLTVEPGKHAVYRFMLKDEDATRAP